MYKAVGRFFFGYKNSCR